VTVCGVDLISDALPFGRLWYAGQNATNHAIGYAKHLSRSHDAVKPAAVIQFRSDGVCQLPAQSGDLCGEWQSVESNQHSQQSETLGPLRGLICVPTCVSSYYKH
jgi:hypothetical protein